MPCSGSRQGRPRGPPFRRTSACQLSPKRPSVPPSMLPAALTRMRTMPTVSPSVKAQLDERRASAFYECAIPFGVATAPASRESTGSIMNRSDDGRRVLTKGPRAATGSVRPGLLRVLAAVTSSLVTAADSQSLSCDSAEWKTSRGMLKCSSFGGKPNAIELADGGAWTHAYQELASSRVPRTEFPANSTNLRWASATGLRECGGARHQSSCAPATTQVLLQPCQRPALRCTLRPPSPAAVEGLQPTCRQAGEGRSAGL
jgi:hypothetical protein